MRLVTREERANERDVEAEVHSKRQSNNEAVTQRNSSHYVLLILWVHGLGFLTNDHRISFKVHHYNDST